VVTLLCRAAQIAQDVAEAFDFAFDVRGTAE
jgi:hypothetical protein